jgi:MGT family glycosyltransferase
MTSKKRIILSTFGSFGDLHPYMALALELQSRGHDPVIATMNYYREKVQNAGLTFAAVRPDFPQPKDQDPELINRLLDPKKGIKFLTEEIIFGSIRESYTDLLKIVESADLLVTHPAAPAGPLVGYKTGMPWISSVLAPLSFFSAYDPPAPPFWHWTKKFRVLGPHAMRFFLDTMMSQYRAEAFNTFREELGIPYYGHPTFAGQHSPTLILAMFSPIFGPPQPDWPRQAKTTGFCFYDGHHEHSLSIELSEFLNAGPAPIIFTLGSTAVWVARDFYAESIKAVTQLGRRAILLIGDERNRPDKVPAGVIAVDYAPYQSLLPRASVIVHSGGVGTTSQALLAGAPTLIVPFAFDQFDNADHALRLGTSQTLYRNQYTAERVAKELAQLINDETYARRARTISEGLKQENGPATAADLIEQQLLRIEKRIEEPAYASGD